MVLRFYYAKQSIRNDLNKRTFDAMSCFTLKLFQVFSATEEAATYRKKTAKLITFSAFVVTA